MDNFQGQPISVLGQGQPNVATAGNIKRGQSRGRGGGFRGRGNHNVPNFGQLQQVPIQENVDYNSYNDNFGALQQNSNRTVIPSSQGSRQGAMNPMGAASMGQEMSGRTVIAGGGEQRVSRMIV